MGNCYENKDEKPSSEHPSDSLRCESSIPFPPIEVERPNTSYANLLYDAYASSGNSELQAITQYIYHHETIENERVSQALMCIAIVEMKHLDALAGLITKLGCKPAFFNSNKSWFYTGELAYIDNVSCCKNGECGKNYDHLCQKIKADILGEKAAIKNYKALLCQIGDMKVKKVIEKIISDEEVHVHIFKRILEDCCDPCYNK